MGWKFWKQGEPEAGGSEGKPKKASKPKELPSCIGRSLIVNMKQEPDWVWGLKCVLRPREKKNEFDILIFEESRIPDPHAVDFDFLSKHPDMIEYSGWFNKSDNTVHFDTKGSD